MLADFPSVQAAGDTVGAIVDASIIPAAVEMMDSLAMEAAEAAVGAGYTVDAPAALIIELDGPADECDTQFDQLTAICEDHGATRIHTAETADEQAKVWKGRKAAFAAVGRISPDYIVQDGVVPRTRLSEVLARIAEMGDEVGLRVANVFHAGDGNLHPLVLYSEAAGEHERAEELEPHRRAVRRARRVALGRARHRGGQGLLDGPDVHRRRPRRHAARPGRVRPRRPLQPRKDLPDAAAVRGEARTVPAAPLEEAGVIERL